MSPASGRPRQAWTRVADLAAVLRKRWDRGQYLRDHAAGEPWAPVSLPVRGPAATELLERLDEVDRWLQQLQRDCERRNGHPWLRIEYRTTTAREVGRNQLPVRVWVDSFEDLVALLSVTADVRALDALLNSTEAVLPDLRPWVVAHPQQAVAHAEVWDRLLATVSWIRAQPTPQLYVRQIDVVAVDTKFIETYRLVLAALLDQVLPAHRVDLRFTPSDFERRYGFRRRPDYTRLRFLAPQSVFPARVSEVMLRSGELVELEPGCSSVLMVENEISYLALPDREDTVAIFGSGFALGSVAGLVWLQQKRIIYWGDIDTYGFAILNRLRASFPQVESVLMDHDTLLAHPRQWVTEPMPTAIDLPHLTESEGELYRDLVEDRYGHHVRLEQERVRFSRVRGALETVRTPTTARSGRSR